MNNKSDTDPFAARIDGQPTAAEIRLNDEVLAALAVEAERSREKSLAFRAFFAPAAKANPVQFSQEFQAAYWSGDVDAVIKCYRTYHLEVALPSRKAMERELHRLRARVPVEDDLLPGYEPLCKPTIAEIEARQASQRWLVAHG